MAERDRRGEATRDRGRTTQRGEEVGQTAGHALSASRRSTTQGIPNGGENLGQGMQEASDKTRRSLQTAEKGSVGIAKTSTEWLSDVSEKLAEAAKQTAEDFVMLMRLPGFGGGIAQ